MSQVGSIYINLLADTAKFTSGINKASNQLSRFANQVDGALKQVEKGLQQFGAKMTTRVTLPIVGFGVAAMKAADQNKKAQESIERMGLQAQKALEPVGRVLIDMLERARPSIEQGIRFVNGLSKAFENLDPATKRAIVGTAALTAAIGPASIALAAATTAVRTFSTGLLVPITNLAKFATATVASSKALSFMVGAVSAVGVALAGFSAGQTLYKEFRFIQEAGQWVVTALDKMTASVEWAADRIAVQLKRPFQDLAQFLSTDGMQGFLKGVGAFNPAANMVAAAAKSFAVPDTAVAQLQMLDQTLETRMNEIEAVHKQVMSDIADSFAGLERQPVTAGSLGLSYINQLTENLKELQKQLGLSMNIPELDLGIDGLIAKFNQFAQAGELAFVQTRAEAEAAAKAIDENARAMDRLLERAKAIRADVRPDEVIAERLRELEQLRDLFPQIISPDVFEDAAKKIAGVVEKVQKRVETFGDKLRDTISGFADDASNALARFAVRGEGSFKELSQAWAEQLLSMALTTQAFKPLFDALGTGLGSIFGATTETSTTPTQVPKASSAAVVTPSAASVRAGGIALDKGLVEPFAGLKKSTPGDGVVVQIIDQRGSGQSPEVSRTRSGDGRDLVKVVIRDTVQELIGTGGMDKPLGRRFGLRPRPQY